MVDYPKDTAPSPFTPSFFLLSSSPLPLGCWGNRNTLLSHSVRSRTSGRVAKWWRSPTPHLPIPTRAPPSSPRPPRLSIIRPLSIRVTRRPRRRARRTRAESGFHGGGAPRGGTPPRHRHLLRTRHHRTRLFLLVKGGGGKWCRGSF